MEPAVQRAARHNRIRELAPRGRFPVDAFLIIQDAMRACYEGGLSYVEARASVRQRAVWDQGIREAVMARRLSAMRAIHRERITGWTEDDSYDKAREGARGEYGETEE